MSSWLFRCFPDPSEGSLFKFGSNLNPLVNSNGQSADLLSMNPSDDFKSITLCWCELELIVERTSDTKKFFFSRLYFIPVLAVLLLCCISQGVYIYL